MKEMTNVTKIIIACAIFGLLLMTGCGVAAKGVSIHNNEAKVRNQFNAQQKNLEVVYDEVWKVISQVAQVTDQHATNFKEIYASIMDSRYSKGDGTLMKWIHEHNPNFDQSQYAKLSTIIEEKRAKFAREQKKILDIKRVHDDMRTTFPSMIICGSRAELEPQLVTSSRTSNAFATGQDDDVNVFQK